MLVKTFFSDDKKYRYRLERGEDSDRTLTCFHTNLDIAGGKLAPYVMKRQIGRRGDAGE